MAFYNRKMVKNKLLTKAWRAAHLRKLDDDEKICLPEICDEIARWIRRDRRPRNRLSLRSFSVLLSGATRLYSQQINLLLKDSFDCSLFTSVTPKPILPAVDQTLRSDCSEEDSIELMPEIEVISDCSEEDSIELMPEIEVITDCSEEDSIELMPEIEVITDTTPSTGHSESTQYPDNTKSSFDGSNSTPNRFYGGLGIKLVDRTEDAGGISSLNCNAGALREKAASSSVTSYPAAAARASHPSGDSSKSSVRERKARKEEISKSKPHL